MFTHQLNLNGSYSIYDEFGRFVSFARDLDAAIRHCRLLEEHDREGQREAERDMRRVAA